MHRRLQRSSGEGPIDGFAGECPCAAGLTILESPIHVRSPEPEATSIQDRGVRYRRPYIDAVRHPLRVDACCPGR